MPIIEAARAAAKAPRELVRVQRGLRLRAIFMGLLLGASIDMLFSSAAIANDAQGHDAAMLQFENDVSCAAAAESWLIGMPNGTSIEVQNTTWNVLGFFATRAQNSAQAVGHPAIDGFGATQAFVADMLPHLKSPDAEMAAKAKAEAAEGTRKCAMLPEFQHRLDQKKP